VVGTVSRVFDRGLHGERRKPGKPRTHHIRVGVDSYSYHRLLGELRPGESAPSSRFARDSLDVVAEARSLALDAVALETCFLPPPEAVDVEELLDEAGPLELVLSWGAPNGFEFGASATARADLLAWLELAPQLGVSLLRIVVAGPALRGLEPVEVQLARSAAPLAAVSRAAAERGLVLALENHGDLRAAELADLVERVDEPALGICFDTANALRVGDDVAGAARLLGPAVRLVHLKDCESPDASADPVAGPRSVPFGQGVIPLAETLAELRDAGFDGLACVEVAQLGPEADELALVADGVAWLRRELAAEAESLAAPARERA